MTFDRPQPAAPPSTKPAVVTPATRQFLLPSLSMSFHSEYDERPPARPPAIAPTPVEMAMQVVRSMLVHPDAPSAASIAAVTRYRFMKLSPIRALTFPSPHGPSRAPMLFCR